MFSLSLRWAVLSAAAPAMLYFSASSALAQSRPEAPMVAAPLLQYRSAMADYRKFDDQPVAPWTQVNDTVGKIGGWRVYAKEAQKPTPEAADTKHTGEPARAMPGFPMSHGARP